MNMSQSQLEKLLKALPALESGVFCEICEEIKIKMQRSYPDALAVIRDPATKNQQPLCALCAIERAAMNQISFADIEVALIIRRYFLRNPQPCVHCLAPASRWCAICTAPTCDACLVKFLRRSCICENCATLAREEERGRIASIAIQGD